jgi:two-component system, OmpR family, phosphate regulon sensor histidine kinase PhoR
MKRYVKRMSYIGALVIMLTLVFGCIAVFNTVQRETVQNNLKALLHTADALWQTPEDLGVLAAKIASGDDKLRVTFVDDTGHVLYDNKVDSATMESHANRPEIIAAKTGDVGIDSRTSDTTGIETLYAAYRVDEGMILRLSYPVAATKQFFRLLLPVIFVLALIIIAAVPLYANRMSDKVTQPLILINKMLMDKGDDNPLLKDAGRAVPEVKPVLTNISYLIEKLKYDFEEVQKTQQLRTDFVANASHELKSPLTSIKGFAELLAGGMVPDTEKQKVYLKRIVSESDRLLNIINDIMRLSKAEGKVMEKAELIQLQTLARDVIQALEPLARARGITVTMDGAGTLHANHRDIWELTYNLVDNALRYGKQGGHVVIHLGNYFLSVEDDGIGMEQEHLTRIFERFYRIDKSHSRQTGGTGLGLSIVKHIAQNYKATLLVKSQPGEGSTFSVQFPCEGTEPEETPDQKTS